VRRIVLLLAVMLAGGAAPAAGQADARVEVTLDTASRDPRVRILNLMEQQRWREALDDAFRISLKWRVELWRRGGFLRVSTNVRTVEFTMVIRREPLLGQYFITYFIPGQLPDERPFRSFEEFVLNLERAVRFEKLAPKTEGSWEYVVKLEVSALDEEQFAEMQRFLEGPGRGSGGGAISNFLLRSMGLPSEKLPAERSPRFRVP
jgi:hypothetical protein